MGILAKAPLSLLEDRIRPLEPFPAYDFLRPPEIGLAMVRGRTGGTGSVFNLGEITLTRCVVQMQSQPPLQGFGFVKGRSHRHAELAAVCDALLQHPDWCETIQTQVIEPLKAAALQDHDTQQRHTAATQVNFFTLARGES
jgi:alpha-D-ribose 1-methylphosphonate 5-triphosphate synthase subunit PhnG